MGDDGPFDDMQGEEAGGAAADAEAGKIRNCKVPFNELHNSIAAVLPDQCATLLLYLLLHGNQDFLEYTLSRTDPDTLLLPMLRALNEPKALAPNQLYMILITILMISQDVSFISASQTKMLAAVPWYRERLLGSISVGSLLVIILVRTVHTNLAKDHDAYVNTNCLAALANMAPHLRKLHPHAARCLLSTCDVFSRRFLKHSRARSSDEVEVPSSAEGAEDSAEALTMFADYLRISLEVINLTLSAGPEINEHLVYALLERHALFEPLRTLSECADLVENIDLVVEHFGAMIRAEPNGEGGQPVWSVATVMHHIREAGREWRGDRMRTFQDLKFTYEQEQAPEEFFTPYIWSLVFERAALRWSPSRLVLFPLDEAATGGLSGSGDVSEASEDPLPVLTTVDVDEGAVTQR